MSNNAISALSEKFYGMFSSSVLEASMGTPRGINLRRVFFLPINGDSRRRRPLEGKWLRRSGVEKCVFFLPVDFRLRPSFSLSAGVRR